MASDSNLLVFQSGGPTAVINASLVGVIAEARRSGDVGRIFGSPKGIEGVIAGRLIDLAGLDAIRLDRLRRTPSAALGTSRHRPTNDELTQVLETCMQHNIESVVAIGGNDTADSLLRLERLARAQGSELRAVLVPKTIDNDLYGTDHCPGYGSIARFIALAARDSAFDTTAMAHIYPVKIIETMGRNAGWVAAAGSLLFPLDGPRPILGLPERPFHGYAALTECVRERIARDGYAVLVVPETLRWSDGQPAGGDDPIWTDAFGHPYYPGAGQVLAQMLTEHLGVRARFDKPGTISRMAMHAISEVDLAEAEEAGTFAASYVLAGATDMMISIRRLTNDPYQVAYGLAPLAAVANHERTIPDEMISIDGTDVTDEFRQYALPLIGDAIDEYESLSELRQG